MANKNLMIKIESSLCEKVQTLCDTIEKKIDAFQLDTNVENVLFSHLKHLKKIQDDYQEQHEQIIDKVLGLIGKNKYDLY